MPVFLMRVWKSVLAVRGSLSCGLEVTVPTWVRFGRVRPKAGLMVRASTPE